jgi:hypothetical protein
LIVKLIGLEVSAIVPPPMPDIMLSEILPTPGVLGLVTVTGIVPAVAKDDAGIVATNWFAVKKAVVCFIPLKLTIAPDAKLPPLIVRVIPGLPACALSGESSIMVGTTPGCDMAVLGGIDPHPMHRIVRKSKEINFMAYSSLTFSAVYKRAKPEVSGQCHFLVKHSGHPRLSMKKPSIEVGSSTRPVNESNSDFTSTTSGRIEAMQ